MINGAAVPVYRPAGARHRAAVRQSPRPGSLRAEDAVPGRQHPCGLRPAGLRRADACACAEASGAPDPRSRRVRDRGQFPTRYYRDVHQRYCVCDSGTRWTDSRHLPVRECSPLSAVCGIRGGERRVRLRNRKRGRFQQCAVSRADSNAAGSRYPRIHQQCVRVNGPAEPVPSSEFPLPGNGATDQFREPGDPTAVGHVKHGDNDDGHPGACCRLAVRVSAGVGAGAEAPHPRLTVRRSRPALATWHTAPDPCRCFDSKCRTCSRGWDSSDSSRLWLNMDVQAHLRALFLTVDRTVDQTVISLQPTVHAISCSSRRSPSAPPWMQSGLPCRG